MHQQTPTVLSPHPGLQRLIQARGTVLLGVVLSLAAIVVLVYNEYDLARKMQCVCGDEVYAIPVNPDRIDPGNDGKLVYFVATLGGAERLSDSEFKVSADNALRLRRTVEMQQWDEKDSKGERAEGSPDPNHTYVRIWHDEVINSYNFRHGERFRNPSKMPLESDTWLASKIVAGQFVLPEPLLARIQDYEILRQEMPTTSPATRSTRAATALGPGDFRLVNNACLYAGADYHKPDIGDVRITYQVTRPVTVSVLAQQKGTKLEPFKTPQGQNVFVLRGGVHVPEDLYDGIRSIDVRLAWLLRGAGFLLLWVGLASILRPLIVVADFLPVVGGFLRAGLPLASVALAAAVAAVSMAGGMMRFSRGPGLILLGIGAGALVLVWLIGSVRQRAAAAVEGRASVS